MPAARNTPAVPAPAREIPLAEAAALAAAVRPALRLDGRRLGAARVLPAGSLRRERPQLNDLDLLVVTASETVAPGFVQTTWQGLLAPKGTPEPILARIHSAVLAVLKEPAVAELSSWKRNCHFAQSRSTLQ